MVLLLLVPSEPCCGVVASSPKWALDTELRCNDNVIEPKIKGFGCQLQTEAAAGS